MANIKDVAKLAGVSISTVSMVVNGKMNINTAKYNAIMKAIKELNYRPSAIAKNMRKQKLHLIGVVMPTTEGHYAQILKGIHSVLDEIGYDIIVKLSNDNVHKEKKIIDELTSFGVSGLLLCPCDPKDIQKYEDIVGLGVLTIFIERKIEKTNFSNVFFDNRNLIYNKTIELLETFKPSELALITGSHDFSNELECSNGFIDAIRSVHSNIDIKSLTIIETSLERTRAMMELLDLFKDSVMPKCFLVSDMLIAEVLEEIFFLIKQNRIIYALEGDVWSTAQRSQNAIRPIPREAYKLGHTAAELIIQHVKKNHKLEECRDIIVETQYVSKDPVCYPKVQIHKQTPLKLLVLRCNAMAVLEQLSRNFSNETGIPVEFTMKNFNELTETYLYNPGHFPEHDILWIDIPIYETLGRSGQLLDLRPWLDSNNGPKNNFPSGIQKCFFDGKKNIFGIPIQACVGMLYYRKDIFDNASIKREFFNKYGFELKPPETWTEYNYVAEFFNRDKNPNSPFQYGTVLASMQPTGGFLEEFYIRQRSFNGSMLDKWGNFHIDAIENIRALENMVTTYQNSSPDSFGYFYEDVFRALLNGKIAFVEGFPVHYLPFCHSELTKSYEFQIGIAPIPGGKHILGAWVFGINSSTKIPDQAYQFLNWAVSEELAVTNGLMGGVIPVKATFNSSLLRNYYSWLDMVDVSTFYQGLREKIYKNDGSILEPYIFEKTISSEMSKAFIGESTVEQAIERAQRSVIKLL